MISTNNIDRDDLSIKVYVNNVVGTEIASKLSGYFVIKGCNSYKFRAIAFGRIGGHNISLSIPKRALEAIRKMQIDPEWVTLNIQRKLIEGDISIMNSSHKKE